MRAASIPRARYLSHSSETPPFEGCLIGLGEGRGIWVVALHEGARVRLEHTAAVGLDVPSDVRASLDQATRLDERIGECVDDVWHVGHYDRAEAERAGLDSREEH